MYALSFVSKPSLLSFWSDILKPGFSLNCGLNTGLKTSRMPEDETNVIADINQFDRHSRYPFGTFAAGQNGILSLSPRCRERETMVYLSISTCIICQK